MIKTIKNILIVLAFQVVATNLLAINPDSLMQSANSVYNQGLYDSAINTYNKVLKSGVESGELYYNLGNAYYKNNDVASAILYYEKAAKLLPNDKDIKYNLSIANSMIVDKIDKVPELFYKKWWNYFYNALGVNAWTIFVIISFALLTAAIGLFVISRTRNNRKLWFYLGLLLLIITIFATTLASQKYYLSLNHNEAIVTTSSLTVKSSPTQNSVDLFVIHEGTKVKIIDRINDWAEIKIQNGSVGWLPESSIKEI